MGSILAETIEAEKIERLVKPVKDLFAAIFFVSVGMMVDPGMIAQYIWPVIIITLTVIIGQATFGTLGVILAGQPLKTALQSGFCLTQIGEFAFIIAGLGMSMKVTSHFLYPIVVAVAVITTFLTPYMIRAAGPVFPYVEGHLPRKWKRFIEHYTSGTRIVNHESNWKRLLTSLIRIIVIYSVIIIAILILSFNFWVPLIQKHIPGFWGSLLCAVIILLLLAPFLRAIVAKKNHSAEFRILWEDGYFSRAYLVSLDHELVFMKSYIELMSLRLSDKVDLQVNLPEDGKGMMVAPLLFITLIENAFKHGISPTEKSFIHICLKVEEGRRVYCKIENSNFPKRDNDRSGSGIGLENLRKRLEFLYSGHYILQMSLEGEQYVAELILSLQ